MTRPLPSRLLRWLLARVLGADEQDALGDIDECFARRLRRRGRLRGEMWYVVEAASLGVAVARARLEGERRGMGGFRQDFRHAVRRLRREPGTTTIMATTLAVAVGATTAIAAVADAAFLERLPYPEADRLVRVYSGSRDDPSAAFALSPLDLRDVGSFDAAVEAIGAWSLGETVHRTDGDEPQRLEAPRASASLFRILGVEPVHGRFFTPDEEVPGGDDAVVLSHGLWTRSFGADPEAVGRTVMLDERRYRVVGIAPPEGMLPAEADAWRPLALGPEWYEAGRWGWQFLAAVARLRPGIGPEQASRALTQRLAESVPQRVETGQTRLVRSLYAERVGSTGRALLFLLAAVGLLLAMACANLMNVVLARAERRVRELGLRRALGSGAGPLVRLVALETASLAVLGGGGGLVLAHLALGAARRTDVAGVGYLDAVGLDLRVASFALALTVATAACFGVAPVLRALRTDPLGALKTTGARAGSSRTARRTRNALVVLQIAVAGALLVAVGLSASTFLDLVGRDPGFRAEGVLTADIELPPNAYPAEAGAAFYRSLLEHVRGLPGVERAGAVQRLPLSGRGWSASIELVDPDPAVSDPDPGGNMRPVAPGYFEVLGIPVLEGRTFTDADDAGAAPVVVVDETLARRYWPGGSPVGRQANVGALTSGRSATIIGVVGSVPDESLASPGHGHVYFSVLQRPMRDMTLVLRTSGDPAALAPALRAAIREADPRIPVGDMSALDRRVRRSLAAPRAALLLLTTFGVVALLLAAVGIYGVLAYTVARRTGEIGTRMALGAAPGSLLRSVVGEAMRLWLLGALFGAAISVGAATLLTRSVEGIRATDPMPYALVLLGLGAVALLAALRPALRATRVDPARTLRVEGP